MDLQNKINVMENRLDGVEKELWNIKQTMDVEITDQRPATEDPDIQPTLYEEEPKPEEPDIRPTLYEEKPEPEFFTTEERTVPDIGTAEPFEPTAAPTQEMSMEFEFGSKWLQYIGILVVAVTFILLTVYSIQYMTPLQENLLIYVASLVLLVCGEYIYRYKNMELYGKGLVFGGFLVAYIACSSSYYPYELIDFPVYIALFAVSVGLNISLGYRYGSSVIMLQGLTFLFLMISMIRLHEYIGGLGYSLLLAAATVVGCAMIYIFKHSEFTYYTIILSYSWTVFSTPLLDGLQIVTLFFITTIFLITVFLIDKLEKHSMSSFLLDKEMEYPLHFIILVLSYTALIFTVIISGSSRIGYSFEYDPWAFLGFLFALQLIHYDQKETVDRMMMPFISFLSIVALGLLTYGIADTIYIYLAFIAFVLIFGYKDIIEGERLEAYSVMMVVSLLIGGVMISLRDHSNYLVYYYESILMFYAVVFCYLHLKHEVWIGSLEKRRKYRISPVLAPLLLLYITTSGDLRYAVTALPILLILFSYRSDDVFVFNASSLLLINTVYRAHKQVYWRPGEIFFVSSLILFAFAVILEYLNKKENIPASTSLVSALMFVVSTAWIFGTDIETTAVWLVFGIISVLCGLYMNRYHLRWIGLFVIIISIFKAFTLDIAELPILMKILSFALLGIMLLIISYIYTKKKDMFIDTFGFKEDE